MKNSLLKQNLASLAQSNHVMTQAGQAANEQAARVVPLMIVQLATE